MLIVTPSYVIPGTYSENLRYLAKKKNIQGVELLFFEYDHYARELLLREIEELKGMGDRFSLSLHLPDQIKEGDKECVELTSDFITRYILHPPSVWADMTWFVDLLSSWRGQYGDRFCLENVPGREYSEIFRRCPDLPVCMDTGHLLLEGRDPAQFYAFYHDRIEEIHLHGIAGGRDHAPLAGDESWYLDLLPFLRSFKGRLNLELFSYEKVAITYRVMVESGLV
jgi:hypothetical protein